MLAAKILHSRIHQSYAAFSSKNQEPENRVAMQLRDALGTPNACTLDQQLNCQQRLFFGNDHRSKESFVVRCVRSPALCATEALKPIAVLPEFVTACIAFRAIHTPNIQQAHAVVNRNKFLLFGIIINTLHGSSILA
ncbi:MAG: hypothetical protein WA213_18910 [Terriglobales bacterium]